jgi:hypothetical protein
MELAVLLGILSLLVTSTAARPPPEPAAPTPAYIAAKKGIVNPWVCLSSAECELDGDGPENQFGDYMTLWTSFGAKVTCKHKANNFESKYVASFCTLGIFINGGLLSMRSDT